MGLALQSVRLFAGLLTELSIAWHATPLVIQLVPTLLTSVGSDPTHPQSTAQLRGDGGGRGGGRGRDLYVTLVLLQCFHRCCSLVELKMDLSFWTFKRRFHPFKPFLLH